MAHYADCPGAHGCPNPCLGEDALELHLLPHQEHVQTLLECIQAWTGHTHLNLIIGYCDEILHKNDDIVISVFHFHF